VAGLVTLQRFAPCPSSLLTGGSSLSLAQISQGKTLHIPGTLNDIELRAYIQNKVI